jgi:Reverse transcriptase (RNA-dependent DNA polymerase)
LNSICWIYKRIWGKIEKKLNEREKEGLERYFTTNELSKSMENSNMNSAAGWDGISYLFIKKFWELIGELLTKAANEGIREGEFSNNFRTGLIRIIPKKGDCTKIEDWRPITLLSCSYKIISGAVAMRIESVILRIIGRGQEGFIKGKNIHMCNMNVMDNISMAWAREEEVGVLCVDFNKAFDSVEHYVILKVFEFFNFGQIILGYHLVQKLNPY